MSVNYSPDLPPVETCVIAVIGLGYVGLPLAVEFAKNKKCIRTSKNLNRKVIGFDINKNRLEELRRGLDRTNEICSDELFSLTALTFSDDPLSLAEADIFIITVPTPIDASKSPNLNPLHSASSTVGSALKLRSASKITKPIIIYESTVYPGATEEFCVPILENTSGLVYNTHFYCGYSPERINPGDKQHRISTITKVTSGSTLHSAVWIDNLYGSIVKAGTHPAQSIKVAEAAKVIENTQRDLNIALINELAIIFHKLDINTLDVLEAAGSKWNFLPFRPGLVGGHCIGVDPYYLTHKSQQLGYFPEVVLAGRRINDGMSEWISHQLIFEFSKKGIVLKNSKILF